MDDTDGRRNNSIQEIEDEEGNKSNNNNDDEEDGSILDDISQTQNFVEYVDSTTHHQQKSGADDNHNEKEGVNKNTNVKEKTGETIENEIDLIYSMAENVASNLNSSEESGSSFTPTPAAQQLNNNNEKCKSSEVSPIVPGFRHRQRRKRKSLELQKKKRQWQLEGITFENEESGFSSANPTTSNSNVLTSTILSRRETRDQKRYGKSTRKSQKFQTLHSDEKKCLNDSEMSIAKKRKKSVSFSPSPKIAVDDYNNNDDETDEFDTILNGIENDLDQQENQPEKEEEEKSTEQPTCNTNNNHSNNDDDKLNQLTLEEEQKQDNQEQNQKLEHSVLPPQDINTKKNNDPQLEKDPFGDLEFTEEFWSNTDKIIEDRSKQLDCENDVKANDKEVLSHNPTALLKKDQKKVPQQQEIKSTTTTTTTTTTNNDNEDLYGGYEISEETLAFVDTLDGNTARRAKKEKPSLSSSPIQKTNLDLSFQNEIKETNLNAKADTQGNTNNNDSSCLFDSLDDSFFADIDIGDTTEPATTKVDPYKVPIQNPTRRKVISSDIDDTIFSRYIVHEVITKEQPQTKILLVSQTFSIQEESRKKQDILQNLPCSYSVSCIHLQGDWIYTDVHPADTFHLCSISGQWRTDFDTLPISLSTYDTQNDLVFVLHPHLLLIPTNVSEGLGCQRRAILKTRLGSTGLTNKSAIMGTMRHDLFEKSLTASCSSNRERGREERQHLKQILLKHAPTLLSCGYTDDKDAHKELLEFIPQMNKFFSTYVNSSSLLKGLIRQTDNIVVKLGKVNTTEESSISFELGIKGNIDATFDTDIQNIKHHFQQKQQQKTLMSLELKTGHNQNPQNAHVAQISLYTFMLRTRSQTRQRPGKGGTLLYLNEKDYKAYHISPTASEAKNLISLRNSLSVQTLKAQTKLEFEEDKNNNVNNKQITNDGSRVTLNLPDLLNRDLHQCKNCYVNRECIMYAKSQIDLDPSNVDSIQKTHGELLNHYTSHLTPEDLQYFREWDRLIDLEAFSSSNQKTIFTTWLSSSDVLEKEEAISISSLVLDQTRDTNNEDQVIIKFRRTSSTQHNTSLVDLKFETGSPVVLSTDTDLFQLQHTSTHKSLSVDAQRKNQLYILKGTVQHIYDMNIEILASKADVEKKLDPFVESNTIFRIDLDPVMYGIGTLRQNLLNLFTKDISPFSAADNDVGEIQIKRRMPWLRNSIIHHSLRPKFDPNIESTLFNSPDEIDIQGCDIEDLACEYHSDLNIDQQQAVKKVISAQDYTLVQGLPGTGKTFTIAFVVRLLVARGKRVLVTSYTHAAVDNLMMKLLESGVKNSEKQEPVIVRIGNKSQCHSQTQKIHVTNVALGLMSNAEEEPDVKTLHKVMKSARIVGCSALTVPRSPLLYGEDFDVVIVDEAGQISQPAIIGVLMQADSFVLVGDHMQLPPLTRNTASEIGGYNISMFRRLADNVPESVVKLTLQYRFNQDICDMCNDIVYNGALKCGNENVKKSKLSLRGYRSNNIEWLDYALDPNKPVLFLNTDTVNMSEKPQSYPFQIKGLEEKGRGSDKKGGTLVNRTEKDLVYMIVEGLLSNGLPPSDIGIISPYRSQIRILLRDDIEVSTIDRYQGRDKKVIILSLVRSNSKNKSGRLMDDFRRLNVAVSRAKHKLLLVGSYQTLHQGSPKVMGPLLEKMMSKGTIYDLPYNAHLQNGERKNDGNSSKATPRRRELFCSAGSRTPIHVSSSQLKDAASRIGGF